MKDSGGAAVEYHYDAFNRKIQEKKRISEGINQVIIYRYDGMGRLIETSETADKGDRKIFCCYEDVI